MNIRSFVIPVSLLLTLLSQGSTTLGLHAFKSRLYSDILDAQNNHDTMHKLQAQTMFSPTENNQNLSILFTTSFTSEIHATDYSIGLLSRQGENNNLKGLYASIDHQTLDSELETTQLSIGYERKLKEKFASALFHYPFQNSDAISAYGERFKSMPGICITLHQDKTPFLSDTMSSELRFHYFTQNDSHINDKTIIQFGTFMQEETWFGKTIGINIEYDFSSKFYWGISTQIPLVKASTTSRHIALTDGKFMTETNTSINELPTPHIPGIIYGVIDKTMAPIPPIDGSDNEDSEDSEVIDGSGPSDSSDASDASDASD